MVPSTGRLSAFTVMEEGTRLLFRDGDAGTIIDKY